MSNFTYRRVQGETVDNVVVFASNHTPPILQADSNHPHWSEIIKGLERSDGSALDLFDVGAGLVNRLRVLSERVTWDGKNVRFDGDVINSVLTDQIKRALEAGLDDYLPLVKFWEKLESNPQQHSKEQAYTWLATHAFKITADGDVVAYKGVNRGNQIVGGVNVSQGGFVSTRSGKAFVDGAPIDGYIPNNPGTVVTMPRANVVHDPSVACHYGLHVGDWSYAANFGNGAVLEVHVNPRDIVSVPVDDSYRKVRTCRYKIVQVITAEYQGGPVLAPADAKVSWAGDVGYAVR